MESTRSIPLSKLYYRVCCFVLFFVAAAASFNGFYDKWHFLEQFSHPPVNRNDFGSMVDGSAARPYVYRQLLPMIASWIERRIPEGAKDRMFAKLTSGTMPLWYESPNSPLAYSRTYFLRYKIVYYLSFLFALIAVYAMYLVCKSVGLDSPTAAISAVIMILLIPYFMDIGGYFYDYPELAFFGLAAWMALRFSWWWMIPVVALAAWNKESFLFFVPTLYPLLRRSNSRFSALAGIGTLGLICAAVCWAIRSLYPHNPGGAVQMHLMDQVSFMLHPSNWFNRGRTYGVVEILTLNPLWVALTSWTLWRGWRLLPPAFQRHAQIAAAINLPLFILFGYPGELRNLSMLYVTLLLLIAENLRAWNGGSSHANVVGEPRWR